MKSGKFDVKDSKSIQRKIVLNEKEIEGLSKFFELLSQIDRGESKWKTK